ncbi:hypothetical protein CDD81_7540 [Ophiocordyceps australis]|uniref:Uncharacterized protein n=1 Tax=Ophiocordyceps australis TaxID=1399860 RepID=A0A2C5X8Z5_9HYPO|nr:hypothetical protein CDD81_7540 [Ophiocordyceps australis]
MKTLPSLPAGAWDSAHSSSSTLVQPTGSSLLRLRLRSLDPKLGVPDGPADLVNKSHDMAEQLRASFTIGHINALQKAVPEYKFLDNEALVTRLGEAFADAGICYYATIEKEINAIQASATRRITSVSLSSAAAAAAANSLHENIASSLSATVCRAKGLPSATLSAHLGDARSRLAKAVGELHALQEEWLASHAEALDAWKELGPSSDTGTGEATNSDDTRDVLDSLKRDTERLYRRTEKTLYQIEKGYRESMQATRKELAEQLFQF